MKSQHKTIAALIVSAALTACGGGASAPATGPEVNTAPVTAPTSTALVTVVPAAGYAAGSEELEAFNLLNQERGRCGFGLLAQNAQLDAAARSHNDYQIINNTDNHRENQQQFSIGFTGVTSFDRATAAGYSNAGGVTEDFAIRMNSTNKSGVGEGGTRSLLNAPYHLASLMGGWRDAGISVRASTETTPAGVNPAVFINFNLGYKSVSGKQLIGASDVATYPCEGSTNIERQLKNESPNPVPGRDLFLNPIGSAVYISVREGQSLTIATASVVETLSNTPVVVRTPITTVNDPNSIFKAHQGYIAPDAPLKPLTEYTVMVTGSNNGSAFAKTFKFKTGA